MFQGSERQESALNWLSDSLYDVYASFGGVRTRDRMVKMHRKQEIRILFNVDCKVRT